PSGPSPHFHKSISESFYILEGSVRIYDGIRWIDTEPGDWVHVPEGGIHAFRNESGAPATMLLHFAPGAPREGYFEDLPDLATKSDEEKAEFFIRHDTYWLG
ncbi:MAG: cupin domain-containing protein, partial [Nonomuraea sp.]|nr:cupin domain-containing protein [Nonomuraea sp.]